jgi:hypothetical protein
LPKPRRTCRSPCRARAQGRRTSCIPACLSLSHALLLLNEITNAVASHCFSGKTPPFRTPVFSSSCFTPLQPGVLLLCILSLCRTFCLSRLCRYTDGFDSLALLLQSVSILQLLYCGTTYIRMEPVQSSLGLPHIASGTKQIVCRIRGMQASTRADRPSSQPKSTI